MIGIEDELLRAQGEGRTALTAGAILMLTKLGEKHRSNFWSSPILESGHITLPHLRRCLRGDHRFLYKLHLPYSLDFEASEGPTIFEYAAKISNSRGVHRWPLCFAIRHAVNAKSVVKLHVCYGESRLFLPFNIGCQPNCKVTDFTH